MAIVFNNLYGAPNLLRRFGNATLSAAAEALVVARPYTEPASQAQRSIVSTSAVDSDLLTTGARQIRITYLDSNYVLKTEDVLTAGLVAVNTVATDIRFIESLEVVKGTDATGSIRLMTTTGGGGSEIAGISAATSQSFMAHHYVPAGSRAYVLQWGAVTDDETSLKLLGQDRVNNNLVQRVFDLEKLFQGNPTPPQHIIFEREVAGIVAPEKTYIRITAVPNQATSTVIRSWMYLWEETTAL